MVENTRPKLQGVLSVPVRASAMNLQTKTVTPTDAEQVVSADVGFAGLQTVTVAPIPKAYGRIWYNGYSLRVE